MDPEAQRAVEAVWRLESPRLLGGLLRLVHDLDTAEDLAHDALVAALESWPAQGVPRNPGAWLMTTARNRALDHLRRGRRLDLHPADLAAGEASPSAPAIGGATPEDDVLRLMLIACHPVLSREAQVALTLRLLGGLTTAEIARAFLASEPTIAQRIVRAKRTLARAEAAFEVPRGEALAARTDAVLSVLYLVFNEGYAATRGEDWLRPALCEDALRLGRMLAARRPDHAEAHGLVALMELQASRLTARVTRSGEPVRLADQDRARWDHLLIGRGLAALARAEALDPHPGPYTLQAAIAACHARGVTVEQTDWRRIVALYDALLARVPSPVVALNRAVAVAMADGPQAGLVLVEALAEGPALRDYHLLPAVRGDLLARLERHDEARAEFLRAARLTNNLRERALLRDRALAAGQGGRP